MNSKHSHLEIVRSILRTDSTNQNNDKQINLSTEEFNLYRNYLLRSGLAVASFQNGHSEKLEPTSSGKSFLDLTDKLEVTNTPEQKNEEVVQLKSDSIQIPQRSKTETMKILRDRLHTAYIIQQADLIRLETQLDCEDVLSEEDIAELDQQQEMLVSLKSLFDTFSRIQDESAN